MKFVRANAIDIAYEEAGSGPPLLLLHGFSLDHTMWAPQVEALQRSYRVITPDSRGLGETKSEDVQISIAQMADDAAALLEALDIPAAAVAGFSMGGFVLAQLAFRHPLKVRAAAFVSTRAAEETAEGHERRIQLMRFVRDEGSTAFANFFLPQLFSAPFMASHPLVVEETRKVIAGQRPEGLAMLIDALRLREHHIPRLHEIRCPCAVIGGSDDALIPVPVFRDIHEGLADSTIRIIEGAGHMTTLEAPDEVSFDLDQLMQRAGMWM